MMAGNAFSIGTASKIGGVFAVRCWRDGTALDRVDEPPTRWAGGS